MEKIKIINESDFIIDVAKDVVISPESTKIHGITHQISKNQGFDIKDILEIFQVCINAADYVVAHNINFDRNMILAECYRNKLHSMESMFPLIKFISVLCCVQNFVTLKQLTKNR